MSDALDREKLAELLEDAITDNGYWHLPAGQIEKGLAALRADGFEVYRREDINCLIEHTQTTVGFSWSVPVTQE